LRSLTELTRSEIACMAFFEAALMHARVLND
jgi:hypothetical protein